MHRFLSDARIGAFEALLGKEPVKQRIGETLDQARRLEPVPPFDTLLASVLDRLERSQFESLVPVVNATGILLHTNLGRAPLAQAAVQALARDGAGYTNLEYDVIEGRRGSRYARANGVIQALTGAQDALVVNNCAAAVLLVLDTFAKGREVIVSRSQLVEIGGGFRLPDVLERSGAGLVEVGATNKVYLADFERALSPRTALLLRSHPSNFRMTGFTHEVDPRDLAGLGRRAGVPVAEDLGSGALTDLRQYGLPHERTVQEAIEDGIDLVTFSGDKLIGGPQAGIVAGNATLIARLRSNPLVRALRVDKLTLAALIATLQLHLAPNGRAGIPFYAMLGVSLQDLKQRAGLYAAALAGVQTVESTAYIGGGSLPESEIPSIAIAVSPAGGADTAARALRHRAKPVIARIEDQRLLLDLRTVAPNEDAQVIEALASIL